MNSAERARRVSCRMKARRGWTPCNPQSFAARVDRYLSGRCAGLALAQVISECADQEPSTTHRPRHRCGGHIVARSRLRVMLKHAVCPQGRASFHQEMWRLRAQVKRGGRLESRPSLEQSSRWRMGQAVVKCTEYSELIWGRSSKILRAFPRRQGSTFGCWAHPGR